MTGAMSDSVIATVAHCDDMAKAAGGSDRTGDGTSRTATTSFFHVRNSPSRSTRWRRRRETPCPLFRYVLLSLLGGK